jgi:8-oxo-dGTP diphosphatase
MPAPSSENSSPIQRVGVIGVIQRGSRYLTIRRGALVRKPGQICFPGGSLIPGETEEQTVVREMREELGVFVEPIVRLDQDVSPWGTQLFWWHCRLESKPTFILHPEEIAEVLWLTLDELITHPDLLESNQLFLERLRGGVLMTSGGSAED